MVESNLSKTRSDVPAVSLNGTPAVSPSTERPEAAPPSEAAQNAPPGERVAAKVVRMPARVEYYLSRAQSKFSRRLPEQTTAEKIERAAGK